MDGVVSLLQVDAAHRRAIDATPGHQADAVTRSRPVERVEIFQAQRALLDGEPAQLVRMVVDRAGGARVPAEREQLEQLVAVDHVARVAARSEVQEGLQRLGPDGQIVEQRADVSRLEAGRRHPAQRLDDPLDRDVHP